jgi:NhaP-type Na+/H+ or K+/H+ antiporter
MQKGIWIYFIFLGVLIFCAHLFSAIFSRRRVPDVLFLVAIGIVLGPVLHWLTPDVLGGFGALFASVTLVFILVDSGIDMHIDDLRRYWVGVVQVMFYSFILSMIAAAVVSHFLAGIDWMSSLLLGSMVAGTGASIVIPMVRQMKVSDKTRTVLTLESALSAVLCIVVALAIMEGFKMGQIRVERIMGNLFASFFMALLLGIVGGMVWSGLLQRVRRNQNSMFLTPAFVFVLYGLTEALGYSGSIAALAFGIVLGNASYFEFSLLRRFRKMSRGKMQSLEMNEKAFFKEIVFILKTFFFVYIGISIPFTDPVSLLYGFIVALVLFVVRFVLIAIVGRENTRIDRQIVSMMIPKGLASAVLASIPRQLNLAAGKEIIPYAERIECMVYAIIFFSIVICSLLVLFSRKKIIDTDYKIERIEEEPSDNEEYMMPKGE